MRSVAAFRLTAQLCLVCAILCLFTPFMEKWQAFALFLVLTLLAGLGAGGCRKAPHRLLWGLLPLLTLVLPGVGWTVRAVLFLLSVYAAMFLTLGRFSLEIWQYRRAVVICCVLMVLLIIISGLGTVRSVPPRFLSAAGVALALLALRAMQLSSPSSARWQAGSAGLFFLPIAGGVLFGTALWLAVPGIRLLAEVLSGALAGAIWLWNAVWSRVVRLFPIGEDFFVSTPVEIPHLESPADISPESTVPPSLPGELPKLQIPWGDILTLLAIAALIALIVWMLRRGVSAARRKGQEYDWVEEEQPPESRARRSRVRKSAERGSRSKVRSIYREYLAYLRSRDVRPNESATTADISAAAENVLTQPDAQLREIYRRCRYSSAPVSEEDVSAARAALDRLLRTEE